MKKLLLFTLGVLVCNAVIGALAMAAMLITFGNGDPVLTAVPVALAAPGLLLQPWYIWILLRAGNPMMAPVYSTIITVPVYALLNRYGALDGAKRKLARLNHHKALLIASVSTAILLGVGYCRLIDFPAVNQGIPTAVQLSGFPIPVSDSRYYCLGRFIDTEWLWQARMSRADVDRLAKMEGLQPLRQDKIGRAFFHMPPYWWRPVITEQTRVLSTPGFPMAGRGNDGDHWLAAWNPDDQVIHIWVKFNF